MQPKLAKVATTPTLQRYVSYGGQLQLLKQSCKNKCGRKISSNFEPEYSKRSFGLLGTLFLVFWFDLRMYQFEMKQLEQYYPKRQQKVLLGHSLGSSRKSVHERPRNSDGWQGKWSVFRSIWLKRQDPQLSNDVYEEGVFIWSKSVKTRIFSKKTG